MVPELGGQEGVATCGPCEMARGKGWACLCKSVREGFRVKSALTESIPVNVDSHAKPFRASRGTCRTKSLDIFPSR